MFKFHQIRGLDITLSEDRTVAETRPLGNSILFSAAPLLPGETFSVDVKEAKLPGDYYPALYLGVTGHTPKEWAERGQEDPNHMTKTWGLDTRDGETWIHGERAGPCDNWREMFGYRHTLSAGDILTVTLCGDSSLSITYKDKEIDHVFSGLPHKPLWMVMFMWLKKIAILHTGCTKPLPPPTITCLKNRTVTVGSGVSFLATIPVPTKVEWRHQNKIISDSPKYQIISNGEEHELKINNCQLSDTGVVSIQASNRRGSDSKLAQLKIHEILVKPLISGLQDVAVMEGDAATLTVDVTGTPRPDVRWFLNSQLLTESADIKMTRVGSKYKMLLSCQDKHTGTLQVKAISKAGITDARCQIRVRSKPMQPTISSLENIQGNAGNDITMKVDVTGQPEPLVKWFLQKKELFPNSNTSIIVLKNKHTLVLRDPQPNQSGSILVRATNTAGSASETATIIIQGRKPLTQREPSVEVHVFDIARNFVESLKMPDACFNPRFDVCFCDKCHTGRGDKLVYTRGVPPTTYGLPIGWCKFGLETKPQARAYGVFDTWHVAFHGTSVDAVAKIVETGDLLLPGDTTPEGFVLSIPDSHWKPDHKNPKMRPPPGHDVKKFYLSPSIKYSGCEVYAPKKKWVDPNTKEDHQIRVAFQVRIKPGVYDIGKQTIGARGTIDPLFLNERLEWSTSRRGVAILVGLLVKIEDMVGNSKINKSDVKETPMSQKAIESSETFMAKFRKDFFHVTSKGREVELKAGDRCWVINQDGKTWQVLHHEVNEPIPVMAQYLRKL